MKPTIGVWPVVVGILTLTCIINSEVGQLNVHHNDKLKTRYWVSHGLPDWNICCWSKTLYDSKFRCKMLVLESINSIHDKLNFIKIVKTSVMLNRLALDLRLTSLQLWLLYMNLILKIKISGKDRSIYVVGSSS